MVQIVQGYPCDYEVDTRFSPIYQKQIKQFTLIIPGGGCQYYRAHKGDVCPFCAFPPFAREVIKGPGHEDFFKSWALDSSIYKQMYTESIKAAGNIDKLAVFNGGSFFPSAELPTDFQQFVCDDAAQRPNVRQLMVEAYPSFIKERQLRETKERLGKTDLMIGIGFESHNEAVRNVMLKKRIDLNLFEEKVRLMQKLGIQVFIYVFLKAPSLTENQALNETLATLQYLYDLGIDEMTLSCAFVPPGTDLEAQYNRGEFRPPWLWSILNIMDFAAQKGWPLSVGGFEDTPTPVAGPSNCANCDPQINGLINHYRLHGQISHIEPQACDCQSIWQHEMADDSPIVRIA